MARICPTCNRTYGDEARFCGQCARELVSTASLTGRLEAETVLQERYVIVRRIAQGGMGAVYLASDRRMGGKQWAVKEMSQQAMGSTQQLEAWRAFRREAEMLGRLSHANLPLVADFFSENEKHYLVMEYVRGETLGGIIQQQGIIPERTVLRWAHQLCSVLSYLHNQPEPIIFRDLKPANVMITPDQRLKLIDFGIARHFQAGKEGDTERLGTPGYAAPEQYGQGQSDERTDVYGLGATLHHLLSGRDPSQQPFHFPPLLQLNPTLSKETAAAVDRAVQHHAADRFPSIAALQAALPVVTDELAEPVDRRRAAWVLPGAIVAALLLFVFAWLVWPAIGRQAEPGEAAGETGIVAPATVQTPPTSPAPDDPPTLAATPAVEAEPAATVETPVTATAEPATPTETPAPTATVTPQLPPGMEIIGYSVNQAPLEMYRYGEGPNAIVFVGGLHAGFAPSSVLLARQLAAHFQANGDEIPASASVYVIPNMNPDSQHAPAQRPGRTNARGVDLNRNWDCNWKADAVWDGSPISGGAHPFSEPETAVVRDLLVELQPRAVIFYEARASGGLVTPGTCDGVYSGSDVLMRTYWTNATYHWLDGLVITGDSTNWAARMGIPAISVTLRSWTDLTETDWQLNLQAVRAVLKEYGQ